MWFQPFFDSLTNRTSRMPSRRVRRSKDRRLDARRLLLESLEDRSLMAFNVLAEYATGPNPSDVLLADVNGDTRPDMIVANTGGNSVGVQIGNADGTFGTVQTFTTGAGPHSVAVGDVNGDTLTDIVTANAADVSVLLQNPDGTYQPPQNTVLPPQVDPFIPWLGALAQRPQSVATGDLDADGKLDVVVGADTAYWYCPYYCGYYQQGYVNVLLGNGASATHPLGYARVPDAVAVEDINGDLKDDVMTANRWWDLSVLPGDGTGALGAPINSGSGYGVNSISLGDVDGDGKLDAIRGGWDVAVQKGNGDGTFTSQPGVNMGIPIGAIAMGDINNDGKLDLVAAGSNNVYTGTWTSTRLASVVLGNGLGAFSLPLVSNIGTASNYGWLADVAVSNLTGDGMLELVAVDSYLNEAIVATNDGVWKPPASIVISDAATVVEGDGTATAKFTVTVTPFAGDHAGVSVDYSTGNYTAVAGPDYTATSGTLNFAVGETSKDIFVPILSDTTDEELEQFTVNLSNAAGGVITDSQGWGAIEDDDPEPLISINDVSRNEGQHRHNTSFVFTISLSEVSGKWVYVTLETADGTATVADSDYYSTGGTAYIAPGNLSTTITVTVRGDKRREPDETFFVNLTGATNGTIGDDQGVGTIRNDDGGRKSSLTAALLADDLITTTRRRR